MTTHTIKSGDFISIDNKSDTPLPIMEILRWEFTFDTYSSEKVLIIKAYPLDDDATNQPNN